MNNPGSVTFLVLFALTTLSIYLSIRRGWLSLATSAGLGAIANVLFFVLFSLSEGNVFTHALVVGTLTGLLFTGMTVAIAAFFKSGAAAKKAPPAPEPPPAE